MKKESLDFIAYNIELDNAVTNNEIIYKLRNINERYQEK